MVEMSEVANILRHATKDSLLILDEIGRGTSTFDGLSIAWAVVEYIAGSSLAGAKTLFATHYHELTELEGKLPGVNNYCIAVQEKGDSIIFLRKIIKGSADRSYGIQVAKLADRIAAQDITFEVTPAALEAIAQAGFDPVYGARPLKRAVQDKLENPVARLLLEGRAAPKDKVVCDYGENGFEFKVEKA